MNCAISESFCQSSFVRRCVEAYANDSDMAGPYYYLREGSRDEYLPEYNLHSVDADTDALMYNDGISARVCVPRILRRELIHEFHDTPLAGHMGYHKVYLTLRKHFYWKKVLETEKHYVAKCDLYQRAKDSTNPTRMPTVSASPPFPFHTLHIDCFGSVATNDGGI